MRGFQFFGIACTRRSAGRRDPMNRHAYLARPDIRAFVNWTTDFVIGERKLVHSWESRPPNPLSFSCQSLWDAYEGYSWGDEGFEEMVARLDEFGRVLRETNDEDRFLRTAKDVMKWGGITRYGRLEGLGENALRELRARARLLDPRCADTDDLRGFQYMGAGYSKVYSLMIDGFPMYDSRVACAVTSLIWLYCRENHLVQIPEQLRLGVPPKLGENIDRNPFCFPNIRWGQDKKYADSNLKAAWLLGELGRSRGICHIPGGATCLGVTVCTLHDWLQTIGLLHADDSVTK